MVVVVMVVVVTVVVLVVVVDVRLCSLRIRLGDEPTIPWPGTL